MSGGRRNLPIYAASIGVGASVFAACTGQWLYSPQSTSAVRPLASVAPPPLPRPSRKPKPPPAGDTFLPEAGELIGLDQAGATRLFGAPAKQFEKPPAAVWRYKNATCELDLFFYLDLRSNQKRTLHYALNADGGDSARCLTSLHATQSN